MASVPRLRHLLAGGGAILAIALGASPALADRILVLPARGAGDDGAARSTLELELATGLTRLGHTLVPQEEVRLALGMVADGVADTADEYRAVGAAAKADWVVAGSVEPAVTTERVELSACLVSMGRLESVAREVERAHSAEQVGEMLAVLVRPEGIGAGELPWERPTGTPAAVAGTPPAQVQVAAPPPALPPQVPEERREGELVHMDYMLSSEDVWPPYSTGRRGFGAAMQGISIAADRPSGARGDAWAIVGQARGGYAFGDAGLEGFAQVGGNLVGPRALWTELGLRWMMTPSVHRVGSSLHAASFHVGPEITAGGFFRFPGSGTSTAGTTVSASSDARLTLGATLSMALSATPWLQLDAQLGNLRWVPAGADSLLLFGATLGVGLRF